MKKVLLIVIALLLVCVFSRSFAEEPEAGGKGQSKGPAKTSTIKSEPEKPKKRVVDENVLKDVKRQIRLIKEELAQLEEKIDRMATTVKEEKR